MKSLALVLGVLLLLGAALAQSGKLALGDSQFESGEYYDFYGYQGIAGEMLTISLQSSDFDPYLIVIDPNDTAIAIVDDSANQGLNVMEIITLPSDGTYTVVVSSAAAGETGGYELSIQSGASTPEPLNPPALPPIDGSAQTQTPEPNVVKGRVTDMQGNPVPGAMVTISGYTGTGANVVEETTTDAQGYYHKAVPSGLYDVDAEAELTFDGETYQLYLHPAEGGCGEEAYSADGIVRNFLFKVSGFKECPNGLDLGNYHSYSGGTVAVNYAHPQALPADAVATFTLTPQGPLADGSQGEVLSFSRTVQELQGFSGPPGSTRYLFDVPLGNYEITGMVTLPGGAVEPLRFGDYVNGGEASSFVFGFDPYEMFPYGIRLTDISMYDQSW